MQSTDMPGTLAIRVALTACALMAAAPTLAQPVFWSGLRAGPHAVGFRILDTVDVTRSFPSPAGTMEPRPMRLYVWYPAAAGAAAGAASRRVTWGEIMRESYPFHTPPEDPRGFSRRLYGREIVEADTAAANARADSISGIPTASRWRLSAASGRFPVVLLTPGSPGGFTVAAELLASHGFVVVGSAPRNHGSLESLENTPNPASIDAEVEDLEFSVGAARGWRNVDARRVGVMGFSTGSLSALAFAFRSRVPTAVVSVEGWEGMEAGVPIIRAYRHHDPAGFRAAFLRIGKEAEEASPAFRKTSVFLDSLRYAPRWRVDFDSATHGDFVGLSRTPRRIFERANTYVLAFLRAQLAPARTVEWLPAAQEAGIHVQNFTVEPPRPGRDEYFRLAETNPGRALASLREIRQRDSTFMPPVAEGSLNRLANLTRDRRPEDAVILNELVAVGYPMSARAAARLSDAYWNIGRRDDARAAARRALDLLDRDAAVPADQRDALRARMQSRTTP